MGHHTVVQYVVETLYGCTLSRWCIAGQVCKAVCNISNLQPDIYCLRYLVSEIDWYKSRF